MIITKYPEALPYACDVVARFMRRDVANIACVAGMMSLCSLSRLTGPAGIGMWQLLFHTPERR